MDLRGRILWEGRFGLNRYERAVLRLRSGSRLLRSAVSGTSRAVRLSSELEDSHRQAIWDTGSDVIGPSFFFFVWWVLEEAKRQGIKRLYFLARDGHILLKIADIINEKWGYGMDCRYLYSSRHAWFLPSITNIGEFEYDWIIGPEMLTLTVRWSCARLGITPESIKGALVKHGLGEDVWDRNMSPWQRERLKQCLNDESVLGILKEKSDAGFKAVSGYLRQEGLFDKEDFGIVDIGWACRSQVALSKILDKAGQRPAGGIKGFYFGLAANKSVYKNDKLFNFLFDLSSSPRYFYLQNNFIYETFAASDESRITGYAETDGEIHPVFEGGENELAVKWGVNVQHESIVKFADRFAGNFKPDGISPDAVYDILDRILYSFIFSPTYEEGEAYGSFKFGAEQNESDLKEIGPEIRRSGLWVSLLSMKALKRYSGEWFSGSLARSRMGFLSFLWKIWRLTCWARILLKWFFFKEGKRKYEM